MKTVYHSFADKIITLSAIDEPEEGCNLIRNLIVSDLIKSGKDIMELNRLIRTFDKRYCEDLIVSLLAKADRSGGNALSQPPLPPVSSGGNAPSIAATPATKPASFRQQTTSIAAIAATRNEDNIEQKQPLDESLPPLPPLISSSLPPLNIEQHKNGGYDPRNGGYIDSISNYLSKGEASLVNVAAIAATPLRSVSATGERYINYRLYEQDKEAAACGSQAYTPLKTCVDLEQNSVQEDAACGCEPCTPFALADADKYSSHADEAETVADEDSCDEGCDDGCLGDSIVPAAPPHCRHSNPPGQPARNAAYLGCLDLSKNEMFSIRIEIWHNKETKGGGISEWAIKLFSSAVPDPNSDQRKPVDVHSLNFSNEPRRYRQNLTDLAAKGKLSADEADDMKEQARSLPKETKVAILSQPINYKEQTIRKGQSQREQRYFPYYWATLIVENDKPVRLTLMLGDEYEPLVINEFVDAANVRNPHKKYKNNAPSFLAKYDPYNTYADEKREQRAMRNKEMHERNRIQYNPANAMARYYEGVIANVKADHERVMQMMMRDYTTQIDSLKDRLESKIDNLCRLMSAKQ